ncbi:tyrosine-type recombinase/integrase [Sphingorhabdus contaminans]|uniref:tyrosine-type recombinase/integrase n=1 Tax=Sphingorhabdus contaminans TaxID=1343899 RepID=UPI003D2B340E
MSKAPLTELTVRSLPVPAKGQTTYWDNGTPGFGVRVSQGGTKTFVLVYGVGRRRLTIGRYPTISLKQARDKAKEVQAGLTLGLLEPRQSLPYVEALRLYLEVSAEKNRAVTVSEYRRILSSHFAFGRKKLNDITRADIQTRLQQLKAYPSEQRHALVALKIFFNWAVREEFLSANPVATLQLPSRQAARERVLAPDELQELFVKAKSHPYPFGSIIQLLILTGQRRGEIGGLRWSWINRDERLITFPAEFTKNHRTHILPYGNLAAAIIDQLPVQVGSDVVFPSRKAQAEQFNSWSKSKRLFDGSVEVSEPYVLHDIRRTYSSTMAQLGTPIHVTEKLLNHVSGTISGVAAIYNRHSYLAEMRTAVSHYDNYIASLCDQYVVSSGNSSA